MMPRNFDGKLLAQYLIGLIHAEKTLLSGTTKLSRRALFYFFAARAKMTYTLADIVWCHTIPRSSLYFSLLKYEKNSFR
jgi:hypothetical protein